MKSTFPAAFFAGNRQKLREAVASDAPIVITANGLLQRNSDNTYPFHQDSSFWYLTGVEEPDSILVMAEKATFILLPGRSVSREAFDGAIDRAALTDVSGISDICDETDGWERLAALQAASPRLMTLEPAPEYVGQYGMYTNPARARLTARLGELNPELELVDIRAQLAGLRMVKQTAELTALRSAIDITAESLSVLTAADRFSGYKNEYEIEADLTREFRFRGASGHAFSPIVAGGARACTLHNIANGAPLQRDTLVVLDVGAEVSHYAADITRTRVFGKPSARQQAVFDAVLDVQTYALGLLRPGVLLKEYEQTVEKYMGTILRHLGLIRTAEREDIRKYFPHATSHYLGLDVHDVGDYSRPLEPGMVVTCEPGIYIPEESIGVRIEDDILITADGNEVLSAKLPKTLM